MKTHRVYKVVAGLLALGLMLAPVVQAQTPYYFWWQVIDQRGRPYPSQAIRCSVYDYPATHTANSTIGSGTAKVLHFDSSLTTGTTMPLLSDSASKLHFFSSSSSDVMVTCFYDRGGAATNVVVSRSVHQVMIDREGRKVVRFPIASNAGTPTRTGIWFGPGDVIRDILVNVTSGPYGTNQANTPVGASPGTPHLNVGFAGAHSYSSLGILGNTQVNTGPLVNGFCTDCSPQTSVLIHTMGLTSDSIGTRDWIRPHVQYLIGSSVINTPPPSATTQMMHVVANHRGAALSAWRAGNAIQGGGAAPMPFHIGSYMELSYAVPRDLEVTYTTSTVPGLSGHVYIFFDSMHAGSLYGGPSNSGLYPNTP